MNKKIIFIRQLGNIPFGKINDYLRSNPVEKLPLGRWNVEHDEKAFLKADYTNEDHCGVCNSMREEFLKKYEDKKEEIKNKKKLSESYDDYKTPFLM